MRQARGFATCMIVASVSVILSVVLPGSWAYIAWALAVLAWIMVVLLEARTSLKAPPSKPASTPPSVAQSLRAAGVEEEWVREYVEKPLGADTRHSSNRSALSSDNVEHLRQLAAMRRAAAARELRLVSQTVNYRPPRMHLHYRAPRERRDDQ